MKKIIIYVLKALSIILLISGIVFSFYIANMGAMHGMLRYFIEPTFNVAMFFAIIMLSILLSSVVYGFAFLIEIQIENAENLDDIKLYMMQCSEENYTYKQQENIGDVQVVKTVIHNPIETVDDIEVIKEKED